MPISDPTMPNDNTDFMKMYNWLVRIGRAIPDPQYRLLMVISSHIHWGQEWYAISRDQLAQDTGRHKDEVSRFTRWLQDCRLIATRRGGKGADGRGRWNYYKVLWRTTSLEQCLANIRAVEARTTADGQKVAAPEMSRDVSSVDLTPQSDQVDLIPDADQSSLDTTPPSDQPVIDLTPHADQDPVDLTRVSDLKEKQSKEKPLVKEKDGGSARARAPAVGEVSQTGNRARTDGTQDHEQAQVQAQARRTAARDALVATGWFGDTDSRAAWAVAQGLASRYPPERISANLAYVQGLDPPAKDPRRYLYKALAEDYAAQAAPAVRSAPGRSRGGFTYEDPDHTHPRPAAPGHTTGATGRSSRPAPPAAARSADGSSSERSPDYAAIAERIKRTRTGSSGSRHTAGTPTQGGTANDDHSPDTHVPRARSDR